jgi:hypothetical protein
VARQLSEYRVCANVYQMALKRDGDSLSHYQESERIQDSLKVALNPFLFSSSLVNSLMALGSKFAKDDDAMLTLSS